MMTTYRVDSGVKGMRVKTLKVKQEVHSSLCPLAQIGCVMRSEHDVAPISELSPRNLQWCDLFIAGWLDQLKHTAAGLPEFVVEDHSYLASKCRSRHFAV